MPTELLLFGPLPAIIKLKNHFKGLRAEGWTATLRRATQRVALRKIMRRSTYHKLKHMLDPHQEKVLILDFGSQYTQLIARRVRELKVYCEIHPYIMPLAEIRQFAPQGIILSGGPRSVYEPDAPSLDPEVFNLGVPVLGICYGIQLLNHLLGGEVAPAASREYGHKTFTITNFDDLFHGLNPEEQVWMSHGDRVEQLAPGFEVIGGQRHLPRRGRPDRARRLYGVQFHPEVHHTPRGKEILSNFLFRICGLKPLWTMHSFIEATTEAIRQQVGDERVICALSGGVDSSVTAMLVHRAIGDRLTCVFVDNGLLRKDEAEEVLHLFREHHHLNLVYVDATESFLKPPGGRHRPGGEAPAHRPRIHPHLRGGGREARRGEIPGPGHPLPGRHRERLLQGAVGHHQDPPQRRRPARDHAPEAAGAPAGALQGRGAGGGQGTGAAGLPGLAPPLPRAGPGHPHPGGGHRERLEILREADAIVMEEMLAAGFYRQVWQAFAVLLPIRTVGVMGDERTYENVMALRIVDSADAMTADWSRLPHEFLARLANRIINEVKRVNRVVL